MCLFVCVCVEGGWLVLVGVVGGWAGVVCCARLKSGARLNKQLPGKGTGDCQQNCADAHFAINMMMCLV